MQTLIKTVWLRLLLHNDYQNFHSPGRFCRAEQSGSSVMWYIIIVSLKQLLINRLVSAKEQTRAHVHVC